MEIKFERIEGKSFSYRVVLLVFAAFAVAGLLSTLWVMKYGIAETGMNRFSRLRDRWRDQDAEYFRASDATSAVASPAKAAQAAAFGLLASTPLPATPPSRR